MLLLVRPDENLSLGNLYASGRLTCVFRWPSGELFGKLRQLITVAAIRNAVSLASGSRMSSAATRIPRRGSARA